MNSIDMVGCKFGMLTVRAMLPPKDGRRDKQCQSDCDCGTTGFVTESYSVRKGLAKSCGCLQRAGNHFLHGESRSGAWTSEYRAWVNMNTRCQNPNATRFKDWGGRGISVFAAWRNDYPAFLGYVGRKPSPRHSLDRFPDVNGNYEPGNVRWATPEQQAQNTRAARKLQESSYAA